MAADLGRRRREVVVSVCERARLSRRREGHYYKIPLTEAL